MKRTPLKRGTKGLRRTSGFARTGAALRRTPIRAKAGTDAIGRETRAAVSARSHGRCEARTGPWCTGYGQHKHHRQLRRHGDHRPINLLDVCNPCHVWIHGHPADSHAMGMLVHGHEDPAEIAVVNDGRGW